MTLMFTIGEVSDLVELAEAWDVPVSLTAWAIVAEQLAILRDRPIPVPRNGRKSIQVLDEFKRFRKWEKRYGEFQEKKHRPKRSPAAKKRDGAAPA
jgi:hypothetical protein